MWLALCELNVERPSFDTTQFRDRFYASHCSSKVYSMKKPDRVADNKMTMAYGDNVAAPAITLPDTKDYREVKVKEAQNKLKTRYEEFEAEFKRLPQSRIIEIQKLAKKVANGDAENAEISDVSIADEVVVGWEGIVDGDGEPLPFTRRTKEQLLELPMMAGTLIEAYFNSLVEEKRGN